MYVGRASNACQFFLADGLHIAKVNRRGEFFFFVFGKLMIDQADKNIFQRNVGAAQFGKGPFFFAE